MNTRTEDHVLGTSFGYRHRGRDGSFADLPLFSADCFAAEEADIPRIEATPATVGAQSSAPTRRLEDSSAHCVPSRRHDGAAAYPTVAEHIPGRVELCVAAAVDKSGQPEMARGAANAGLLYAGLGYLLPRCLSVHRTDRDSTMSSTS